MSEFADPVYVTPVKDAIKIEYGIVQDGVTIVAVNLIRGDCISDTYRISDVEAYFRMPDGIDYGGNILGKSGWNSDTNTVYYRSDKPIAYRLDK